MAEAPIQNIYLWNDRTQGQAISHCGDYREEASYVPGYSGRDKKKTGERPSDQSRSNRFEAVLV